jgi:UDP-N-acetylmuramoyl-tripeptide--D-alanyl-D-alanine ligase
MLLSKSFLLKAVPGAEFFCGMMPLSLASEWVFYNSGKEVEASFDSRAVTIDSIFFALKGQVVDGHDFLKQALQNGAGAFVVSKNHPQIKFSDFANKLIIVVPDTYQALIDMAKAWRSALDIPIVGISGSIGKTSTKEILRSILKQDDSAFYISVQNQNTFIGLCVNILNVKCSCKIAAFEVGISEPGEMAVKADILLPTIGLITRISYSHMSQFGTLQNIANEKRLLFKNFKDREVGIIFGDQALLTNVCYHHPISTFGFKTKNRVQARKIKFIKDQAGVLVTEFTLKWYGQKTKIKFNNINQGLISNVLAAATIAYFLKIPFTSVIKGIESYSSFENRFEQKKLKNNLGVVISDCYNANPESMKAAITAFTQMQCKGKKIAVLGDMLELGSREIYWHRNIGKLLNKMLNIDSIILVGNLTKYTQGMLLPRIPVVWVKDCKEAARILKGQLKQQDSLVLVKASHGMALDKLVEKLAA